MTLKLKRNLPLAFILILLLSSLVIALGNQPIVAYYGF